jgi:hypothetical protein
LDLGSRNKAGQLQGNATGAREEAGSDRDASDEEDIWANQGAGRQTYGSFKSKRKSRPVPNDHDVDLASEESGETDADGSDDSEPHARSRQTPGKKNKSGDVDSDEEMRQVRKAIEAKHRSMMGTTPRGGGSPREERGLPLTGNRGGFGGGQRKRGREEGGYKSRKKARQTI